MINLLIVAGFAAVLLFLPTSAPAEMDKNFQTVKGLPKIRITADAAGPVRYDLNKEKQEEYALSITQANGQILWKSRDNKPLTHTVIGVYDNFVGVNDASYVKVLVEKGHCTYMEHLNFHFNTVTYFGECEIITDSASSGVKPIQKT